MEDWELTPSGLPTAVTPSRYFHLPFGTVWFTANTGTVLWGSEADRDHRGGLFPGIFQAFLGHSLCSKVGLALHQVVLLF